MFTLALIFFLAAFVQSMAGFGMALVAMPLLVRVLAVEMATPLVAIVAFVLEFVILLRYREAFRWRAVSRITLASLLGVPLGVWLLQRVDAAIITTVLGVIVSGYALYALVRPVLPQLTHNAWAYSFGFLAGMLGGAYGTSGPPVIVYGTARRWPPAEFKSNLQGFFLVNGLVIIVSHAVSGNVTAVLWQNFLFALPGLVLGLLAGLALSDRLDPNRFRQLVLVLLLALGASLLWSGLRG